MTSSLSPLNLMLKPIFSAACSPHVLFLNANEKATNARENILTPLLLLLKRSSSTGVDRGLFAVNHSVESTIKCSDKAPTRPPPAIFRLFPVSPPPGCPTCPALRPTFPLVSSICISPHPAPPPTSSDITTSFYPPSIHFYSHSILPIIGVSASVDPYSLCRLPADPAPIILSIDLCRIDER